MESFESKGQPAERISGDDISRELKDIRTLGSRKAMGYFPIDQLKAYSTVENEIRIARERGYEYFEAPDAPIGSEGALYVYDEASLQAILEECGDVLEKYHWPSDPDAFVRKVSEAWIDDDARADLRGVIQKAFGRR